MKQFSRNIYADRFLAFSAPVEKWLMRAAALLLIAVLLSQALLLSEGFRQAVTKVDRYEGVAAPGELADHHKLCTFRGSVV